MSCSSRRKRGPVCFVRCLSLFPLGPCTFAASLALASAAPACCCLPARYLGHAIGRWGLACACRASSSAGLCRHSARPHCCHAGLVRFADLGPPVGANLTLGIPGDLDVPAGKQRQEGDKSGSRETTVAVSSNSRDTLHARSTAFHRCPTCCVVDDCWQRLPAAVGCCHPRPPALPHDRPGAPCTICPHTTHLTILPAAPPQHQPPPPHPQQRPPTRCAQSRAAGPPDPRSLPCVAWPSRPQRQQPR